MIQRMNYYNVKRSGFKYDPCLNPDQIKIPEIDALATQHHFLDHILPVFKKLPHPGILNVSPDIHKYAKSLYDGKIKVLHNSYAEGVNPIITAAVGDLRYSSAYRRPQILINHGAGFTFSGHASYAGGKSWRAIVNLFQEPGIYPYQKEKEAFPKGFFSVCGCPKLDDYYYLHQNTQSIQTDPITICFAVHWGCKVCPETDWAYPFYSDMLPELAKKYKLIVHAHPRSQEIVIKDCKQFGIEFEPCWNNILKRTDISLYINDASSTMYEWSAVTDKPVVILNSPLYRRNIFHGLRFWDFIPGVQVNHKKELLQTVEIALEDSEEIKVQRRQAANTAYANIGNATDKFIQDILSWQNGELCQS